LVDAYVITKVGGVTNIYINSSTTSAVSSTQTMVSPGTSVNVGIALNIRQQPLYHKLFLLVEQH
jgi:hypothetical protein